MAKLFILIFFLTFSAQADNIVTNNCNKHEFKKFLVNFTKLSSFNTTVDGRSNSHPLFDYYSKHNKKRFSGKTLDQSFFKNDLVVVSNKDFYS